jgi:hypothetical protein
VLAAREETVVGMVGGGVGVDAATLGTAELPKMLLI